ncbi:MAG: diacylglycerol kinase family protein [Actinomycetota bacterium]
MAGLYLLVNPARTRRRGVDERIRSQLANQGHRAEQIRPDGVDDIAPAITRANANGDVERLLIAGGDGLLHHALPALAGSGIDVGIVGVGTGNDFARALGLPTRVAPAVTAALAPARPVDLVATGDGRYAASVVTGGFSGTVNARANNLRFPPGQQRYTVATLLELPRLQAVDLQLTVDGDHHDLTSSMFAVANTRFFGGGMAICPDATPTDGLLDVTVIGPTGALTLGRMLPTVFSGRHVRHPAVTTYRGAEITITTDTALWADGEPFGGQTFTAARGALRVATNLTPA